MALAARLIAAVSGFVLMSSAAALAQTAYPNKSVRIVIPFAPGGVPDIIARLVAPKMTETMGQPFVVDNRPGAGGTLAAAHVAKSDPDGYTLFMTTVSTQAIAPNLMANLPYDAVADFAPISHIANVPLVLVITPALPASNLKDFIALLKANPGKYDFASSGAGAPLHLAGELFKAMSRTDIQHVAYKGSAPALTDVMGGRVAMVFDAVPPALGHIQSGRLRALGVGTKERSAMLPDVPTIEEAGLPGYEAYTWGAFFAPARTPQPVVDRLHAEVTKALAQSDVKQRLTDLGYQIVGSTPAQLEAHVRAEKEKWGKLIRDVGIKADL
jgi:tripartite-type tricarboxylate transporter receptor subunit TctC